MYMYIYSPIGEEKEKEEEEEGRREGGREMPSRKTEPNRVVGNKLQQIVANSGR